MANEITVRSALIVRTGNIDYRSQPVSFQASMAGANGPTPGALTVPVIGLDVTFPQLTAMGGPYRILNLDPTNYVERGVRDPVSGNFYPLDEIGPGECYVGRLSRNLGKEEVGTGSAPVGTVYFHLRANAATCTVILEAFDP